MSGFSQKNTGKIESCWVTSMPLSRLYMSNLGFGAYIVILSSTLIYYISRSLISYMKSTDHLSLTNSLADITCCTDFLHRKFSVVRLENAKVSNLSVSPSSNLAWCLHFLSSVPSRKDNPSRHWKVVSGVDSVKLLPARPMERVAARIKGQDKKMDRGFW